MIRVIMRHLRRAGIQNMIKVIPSHPPLAKGGWGDFLIKIIFRNHISFLYAFTFLILLFSACTHIEKVRETKTIKNVVIGYNKGLINAAKTGDMMPLKDIASEAVLRRLYFWIAAWDDSDLYMDAELKGIKFKDVDISGQKARVLTSEDWIYDYRNLKTEQVILPTSDIYYEMEYILQKKDNKWIITEINIKVEKTVKDKE